MTKKAAPKIYFILLLLFILLTGCSDKKASESAVSPEAEAVITAMFTAPNEELYSPDASNVIGENTDANSDDTFANSEKILENWNKLVGKYFEHDRLEYFDSTYGQTYLSEAAYNNTKITIKDISLDFKTDAKLRQELNQLVKKTKSTVLLVGQRIASIMDADQIIVLDEGRIVGKGTHEELMKSCQVYQEIAYSQLSKEELSHE